MNYVRKDGSHLTVNLVVTSLRDASGGTIGFLGVAMDGTAQRSAENNLRASEERLRLMIDAVDCLTADNSCEWASATHKWVAMVAPIPASSSRIVTPRGLNSR